MIPPYLSYIIPFYNGKDTIHACLDSIYSLGLSEEYFEVIVVDDNSPIRADIVLSEFQQSHSNIHIVRHSTNKRQGGAKNTGIKMAQGTYIALADQDDVILDNGIESVLQNISKTIPDIISCQYIYNYEDGRKEQRGLDTCGIFSGKEFCEKYFDAGHCVCPWGYLYRREFLMSSNHPMAENILLEASDWIEYHLAKAQSIQCVPIPIYQWNVLGSSTSHQNSPIHVASWIKLGYRKIQIAEDLKHFSPKYANTIEKDGRGNIIGSFNRLWKSYGWEILYKELGKELLLALNSYQWPYRTSFMIKYPKITVWVLQIVSPVKQLLARVYRKIRY